eukprot:3358346-Rhodomonas_salina.1
MQLPPAPFGSVLSWALRWRLHSLPLAKMTFCKDSTAPEQRAARVLECWSLQFLCCRGATPAHFRSVLSCGASLAAALAATGQDDLLHGFHGARTACGARPGVLEPATPVLQQCATSTFSLCARQRRFAGGCACGHRLR